MTCEVGRSIQKTGGMVQKSPDLFQEWSMCSQCSSTCKKNWSICQKNFSIRQKNWSICQKKWSICKKNWSFCQKKWSICKKNWSVRKRDSCRLNDERTEFEQGSPDKLADPSGTHAKARTCHPAKPKLRHKCRTHPPILDRLVRVNRKIEFGCPRALRVHRQIRFDITTCRVTCRQRRTVTLKRGTKKWHCC